MKKILGYLGQNPGDKVLEFMSTNSSKIPMEFALGLSNGSLGKYTGSNIKELEETIVSNDPIMLSKSFAAIGGIYDVFKTNPEKPIERQPVIFDDVMVITSGHLTSCLEIKEFLLSYGYRPKYFSSAELLAMLVHHYRGTLSIKTAVRESIKHLEDVKSLSFIGIDLHSQSMITYCTGNQSLFFKSDRESFAVSSVDIPNAGFKPMAPNTYKVFSKCFRNHLIVESA